jgi:hypothetical protein
LIDYFSFDKSKPLTVHTTEKEEHAPVKQSLTELVHSLSANIEKNFEKTNLLLEKVINLLTEQTQQ